MGAIDSGVAAGLALGMRHALDADHLVAVTNLLSTGRSVRRALAVGLWWGLGHAAAVVAVGGLALGAGWHFPTSWQVGLEAAVGGTIMLLGFRVARRHWRAEVHWRRHRHGAVSHAHFHRHEATAGARSPCQAHQHTAPVSGASLVVGVIHGLAGGGPLVILLALASPTLATRFAALIASGIGSIVGMLLVTIVLALPFTRAERVRLRDGRLRLAVGALSVAYGAGFAIRALLVP